MTFDTAHQRDQDDPDDKRKHDRVIAQQLARLSGGHIDYGMAAIIAGTTPALIGWLVRVGTVAGNRRRRTCSLGSLEVWMATRPKKVQRDRRTDPPNE